ncbi:MAG: HIT family protein [Candidatus Rokubacteria bacterium]|nr:HIT family protein [Candidatus Rokubacteria bacterium]
MTDQEPRPSDCVACLGHWPAADHRIADLGATVAYLNQDQFFRGWTYVVLKRHATELFELSREERGRLIEEVSAVARALATVFGAVKLNYELLGNQVAHIHWHVVPRLAGDPSPREPVWRVPHDPRRLTAAELRELIGRIRQHL